jgi:hypothetical protein
MLNNRDMTFMLSLFTGQVMKQCEILHLAVKLNAEHPCH